MKDCLRVIALGFFDGVHIGHASIIESTRALARELGASACVLSFSEHPQKLKGSPPELLTSTRRRCEIMKSLGMDEVIELTFDGDMLNTSARDFVQKVLYEKLRCAGAVCGESFRFGKGAKGDTALLESMCGDLGIRLRVCPQLYDGDDVVSSTLVRALIKKGDIKRANSLMARPLTLDGRVFGGRFIPQKGLISLPPGLYKTKANGRFLQIAVSDNEISLSENTESFHELEIIEKC